MWIVLSLLTSLCCLQPVRLATMPIEQYCEEETFEARCADDEVIYVSKAVYGRMKIGKCIPEELAFLMGCSSNVLPFIEHHCSGYRNCSVAVRELMTVQNCTTKLRSYLEVEYTCIEVVSPGANGRHCESLSSVIVPKVGSEGYISSYVSQQTGCGSKDIPWILKVGAGQRLNITLIDFTGNQLTKQPMPLEHTCIIYASIRDGSGPAKLPVCGGTGRKMTPVFESRSNSVEIGINAVKQQNVKNYGQFLLKYVVEGCADPDLPEGTWMKRDASEALVGCRVNSEMTWTLKCVRGNWFGEFITCSKGSLYVSAVAPPVPPSSHGLEPKSIISVSETENKSVSIITKDVIIVFVSGLAVLISLIIFIFGLCYMKRKKVVSATIKCNPPLQVNHLTYGQAVRTMPSPVTYAVPNKRKANLSTIQTATKYQHVPQKSPAKYSNTIEINTPPPSYEPYPTTNNTLPSASQTPIYSNTSSCAIYSNTLGAIYSNTSGPAMFSNNSSTYNSVNKCNNSNEHVYESTFITSAVVVASDAPREDITTDRKYFVLDPNYVPAHSDVK